METKTDSSLCRVSYTNLLDIETNKSIVIPGFNAFCASILPSAKTNDVGYFPLITSSPTNSGVVKTAMQTLVNAVKAVNMKHTVITCDLAIYDVVLQLGGFYLCYNHEIDHKSYESGVETIFFELKSVLPGTENNFQWQMWLLSNTHGTYSII